MFSQVNWLPKKALIQSEGYTVRKLYYIVWNGGVLCVVSCQFLVIKGMDSV